MKDAFKRYLLEQLGPLEDKPLFELGAWSLTLIEITREVRERQLDLQDSKGRDDLTNS